MVVGPLWRFPLPGAPKKKRERKTFYTCTVDTKNKLIHFLCVFSRISDSDVQAESRREEKQQSWQRRTNAAAKFHHCRFPVYRSENCLKLFFSAVLLLARLTPCHPERAFSHLL